MTTRQLVRALVLALVLWALIGAVAVKASAQETVEPPIGTLEEPFEVPADPHDNACRYDWEAAGLVDDACDLPGRWVYVGPYDGLMRCESSPSRLPALAPPGTREARNEVRIDQTGGLGERTGFQFLGSTWRRWTTHMGKPHMSGVDPWTTTLAQQLKVAEWGRRNVGIRSWSCGYRYGTGDGWVYITGEHHVAARSKRCARRLHDYHGFSWRISRSVCGR